MSDLTHTLAALLFKAALDRDLVQFADIRARIDRSTLTHESSAEMTERVDFALSRIQRFCKRKGWPPLTALYVRQPHCVAPVGFYKSMGFDSRSQGERLAYWKSCVDAVYSYFDVGAKDD